MDTRIYKTKDIYESAYLHSLNIPLLGLEKSGRYYYFLFDSSIKDCEVLANDYWAKRAVGNVKQFVDSLKTLKDLIFSRRD